MGQRVIPANVDTVARPALHGNEHSVVLLRAVIGNDTKSADFASERRAQKSKRAAKLRIRNCRTGAARRDFIVGDLAVQKAVAVGIADAWNEVDSVDRVRRLNMNDLSSQIAYRD